MEVLPLPQPHFMNRMTDKSTHTGATSATTNNASLNRARQSHATSSAASATAVSPASLSMRCMVCAQHFADANALFAHMNAVHSGGSAVSADDDVEDEEEEETSAGSAATNSDDDRSSTRRPKSNGDEEEDDDDDEEENDFLDSVKSFDAAHSEQRLRSDEENVSMRADEEDEEEEDAEPAFDQDEEMTIIDEATDGNGDPIADDSDGDERDDGDDDDDNMTDYSHFEYNTSIMEPICELTHNDDDHQHNNHHAATVDHFDRLPSPIAQLKRQLHQQSVQHHVQKMDILRQIEDHQRQLLALQLTHRQQSNALPPHMHTDPLAPTPPPGVPLLSLSQTASPQKQLRSDDAATVAAAAVTGEDGQPLFQCTQCDQSFAVAGDLARHVRSHTLNKPFQCSICDKTFTHIGSLNTHLRIHSGEKPYKCTRCPKAFTQSSSLMVHLRSHATKKRYQCSVCDKGFVNSTSLLAHQRQHEEGDPFPCTECEIGFKQAHLLEEHMAVHRNVSLYQCSICR